MQNEAWRKNNFSLQDERLPFFASQDFFMASKAYAYYLAMTQRNMRMKTFWILLKKNHLVWQVSSVYKTWSMHNENLKDGPQKSGLNFDEFGPIMYTMSISTF